MKDFVSKHPYLFAIAVFAANALLAVPFVALFSLGHFSNLFFEDFSSFEMIEKLIVTFGFALLYGAVYLRTLNIWPLIVLHVIHDFMFLISGTAGPYEVQPLPTVVHIVVGVLSVLYGVYLVRHIDSRTVLSEMDALEREGGSGAIEAT